MRAQQRKLDWTILAMAVIAAVITLGVVAAAAPESADTSRVVSVQRLPENLDQCTWDDSAGSDPRLMASLQQNNLFSARSRNSLWRTRYLQRTSRPHVAIRRQCGSHSYRFREYGGDLLGSGSIRLGAGQSCNGKKLPRVCLRGT